MWENPQLQIHRTLAIVFMWLLNLLKQPVLNIQYSSYNVDVGCLGGWIIIIWRGQSQILVI
jgi:hypothetical protein